MQIDTTIPEFEIIVSNEIEEKDTTSDNAVFEAPEEDVEIIADSNNESEESEVVEAPLVERNYSENADPAAITVYEQLLEKGYVDETEEFDGTWDKLDSSLEYLPQKVLNSLVANTSDVSKDIIRFVFSADNITADEMSSLTNSPVIATKSQEVEDLKNQYDEAYSLYKNIKTDVEARFK